jgi:signal transduction histidine kinase
VRPQSYRAITLWVYAVRRQVGYRQDMSDLADDHSLRLPLARRLAARRSSPAELLAIDVVTVVAITVIFEFFMHRPQPVALAAFWAGAGWVVYTVAAAAVLFRRRLPRITLAVVAPAELALLAFRVARPAFFIALALYSAGAVLSRRANLILAGVLAAATLGATIAGRGDQVIPASIGSVALVLLGWLAAENARAGRAYGRQQAERAAEKAAAAETEHAEQVRRALAGERAEIARELHDIVAHAMSVIAVRSGVARMVLDSDPQQAREALGIIETTTRRSLQEMRLLVGVLRDDDDQEVALKPAPGLADLDRLAADLEVAGVAVDLHVNGSGRVLPPAADLSAYRIVQEALTNVVRHAGPTRAHVRISYRPDEVAIEVLDDGPPGDRESHTGHKSHGGHGLIGMRERAALFGGELTAGPDGAGFRVRARLRTTDCGDPAALGLDLEGRPVPAVAP